MCVCHQWLRRARHRLIRHRYAPFGHRPHGLRLLHVRSLFHSIAMETGRAVLAGSRVRPLEKRGKLRPNRNRHGSPDQRREAIQRRKSLHAGVSAVRTHPANPFENRRNSPLHRWSEQVRNGDGGGGSGTGVEPSLPPKPLNLLSSNIVRRPKSLKCAYNPTLLVGGIHRLSRRFKKKCTRTHASMIAPETAASSVSRSKSGKFDLAQDQARVCSAYCQLVANNAQALRRNK
ncbi:hypothetical protein FHS77_002967 [Paenochrobactrum gallinarii]|uniref:Uncharacterized protein n=1 Tax=Paenochrobactrum gallinarii TaxID=643673 RepID=A0A841LW36_9HYPH|nr:hypothetical protein [Paenochrobactrum gallinarii]